MTFEEILDHAIAMLQRRGRLTYGTLKRQFQLDDAALEDLKNELIKGQRLAVDEDGEVLVWTDAPTLAPSATAASGDESAATRDSGDVAGNSGCAIDGDRSVRWRLYFSSRDADIRDLRARAGCERYSRTRKRRTVTRKIVR